MARAPKESIYLVSSAGTGYFYINRKNKKKFKGEKKMAIKKYDPILREVVLFEEKKLSRLKKKFRKGQGASAATEGTKKGKDAKKADQAATA